MRQISKLMLAAIPLITLYSCASATRTASQPAGKVVCVLVDRSGSTDDPGVRQRYMDSFDRILEKVGSGDLIVADAITGNPLAQSSFPVNDEFEAFQPATDNPLMVRKQEEEHQTKLRGKRDEVRAKAEALFASAPSKATKILDAISLADRVFRSDQRRKKVLVIFSDMAEESETYNFKRERLTEAAIARIIAEEKQTKRLPDLTGIKVYVIGAGAGGDQPSSSEQYRNIESFWLEYFKSAGADLAKERYGAALFRFDE